MSIIPRWGISANLILISPLPFVYHDYPLFPEDSRMSYVRSFVDNDSAVSSADPDWSAILSYLPGDWEDMSRKLGAFTRTRGFSCPEALLRTLFIHLAEGCSLRETAIRAKRGGIAEVSDVAILKRLRSSEAWLQYLATSLAAPMSLPASRFRLCAVDATVISEPGSTGTDWRLHYMLEMPSLTCMHFELTDVKGGESFSRFPVRDGDLLVADRGYKSIAGIDYIRKNGGDVIVRIHSYGNTLRTPDGQAFDLLSQASDMSEGEERSWLAIMRNDKGVTVSGRVCVYRLDEKSADAALRKAKHESSRKQHVMRPSTIEGSKYVVLFTTVSEQELSAREVFSIYRLRWQVELAFKRMKSLTGFGHLPKNDPVSCRAWLYGKLLVGLLVESMVRTPFPP
jgi:hypothetical protein